MSWLFGKKKHHKESPPDTSEEDQLPSEQGNDYIFVDKNPAFPDNSNGSNAGDGRLYPFLSGVPTYATTLPTQAGMNQQADYVHYLSGVPFKFCKRLEHDTNSDIDIDKLRVNEILSFIERIQEGECNYDFSIEEAVITEMNSTNEHEPDE